ncbi:DNA topoisomerase 2-beta [Massospora cicadina]|nr:DNA topoisomerase 2-beta [Massospora cicadina]
MACFILAIIKKELVMHNVMHTVLISHLIEMVFDPIKTKDDDRAINSGFNYLFNMKMINMIQELAEILIIAWDAKLEKIEVLCAKSPLDLWNTDLNLFLKLWEEKIEEIQITFALSLTEGTSCSNKKGFRFTPKPKLNKKSKETKLRGLARPDSASKPAAVKLELPSHAKDKLGCSPLVKPLSHSKITLKTRYNLI